MYAVVLATGHIVRAALAPAVSLSRGGATAQGPTTTPSGAECTTSAGGRLTVHFAAPLPVDTRLLQVDYTSNAPAAVAVDDIVAGGSVPALDESPVFDAAVGQHRVVANIAPVVSTGITLSVPTGVALCLEDLLIGTPATVP